jgi:transposase
MAVCSPGTIERRPGDRIKTDKRDAIRLARLLAAGELRLVWIPANRKNSYATSSAAARTCERT